MCRYTSSCAGASYPRSVRPDTDTQRSDGKNPCAVLRSSHCPETALYKTHSLRPPDIVRSNTRSSLDNSRSYYHLTKEKVRKENPLRRGSPAGGKGKRGAKSGGYALKKRKSPPPFPPRCGGIESAATMENPMGLPQWLGKPLTRFTTLQHPSAHPLFPSDFLPFREKI